MTATPEMHPAPLIGWGYEGRSIEDLVDDARAWNVAVVVDVRLNAISRRKGFSKRALASALADAGIEYLHFRGLGNPRDNRPGFAEPGSPAGRRAHDKYRGEVLRTPEGITDLRALAARDRAIVLCFEAQDRHCHRSLVLDAVRELRESEQGVGRA